MVSYTKKEKFIVALENSEPCTNSSICTKCGGACCKTTPCGMLPHDIGDQISVESVVNALNSGKYMIYLDVKKPKDIIIPTMAAKQTDEGRIKLNFLRKKCALLTLTGCPLSKLERPSMGLSYIPGTPCKQLVSNQALSRSWMTYRHLMASVIKRETGMSLEELYTVCYENTLAYFAVNGIQTPYENMVFEIMQLDLARLQGN